MERQSLLMEMLHSSRHLLLPNLCQGCRRPMLRQERVLCLHCNAELPGTNFGAADDNDAALRLAGRVPFQHTTAFAYFRSGGLMQHLLHRLKYRGRKEVGIFLGQQAGYALAGVPWLAGIDCIVPVPLHPRKEAKRGFNQSAMIAQGLSDVTGLPLCAGALLRKRNTESQTMKSREERVQNVRDAFHCPPGGGIAGKHVLLVDDVLTTGATLEAAAGAVLAVPGASVSLLAMAIAM